MPQLYWKHAPRFNSFGQVTCKFFGNFARDGCLALAKESCGDSTDAPTTLQNSLALTGENYADLSMGLGAGVRCDLSDSSNQFQSVVEALCALWILS
jgi:hypothetical protein